MSRNSDAIESLLGRLHSVLTDGSNDVMVIQDEGTGIDAEALLHIHEWFFTTRQDSGGIGLGVSISSRIVEEHGGTMRFTSEPGSGTTVTITLPAEIGGNPY